MGWAAGGKFNLVDWLLTPTPIVRTDLFWGVPVTWPLRV